MEPESGMEKHFARVCRGEGLPVTPEEREWYEFVTDDAAVAAQRESERINEEVAQRVTAVTRHTTERVTHLDSVVERQQQLIQSLMKQLQEAKSQIKQYQVKQVMDAGSGRIICPVCDGDGGAKGECYKCRGTGWADA
jgi:hypothetical protein